MVQIISIITGEEIILNKTQQFCFASYGPKIIENIRNEGSYKASFPDKIVVLIQNHPSELNQIMLAVLELTYPSPHHTRDNKIMNWILTRLMLDRHNDQPILAEDLSKIGDDLSYFTRLKNSGKVTGRHITEFESLSALSNFLIPYQQHRDIKNEKRTKYKLTAAQLIAENNAIMRDTTFLYDDEDGKVVVAHSHKSSHYFGKNTQWCIARDDGAGHFASYNDDSPIIVIIPTNADKYALVAHKYYDIDDNKYDAPPQQHANLLKKAISHHSIYVQKYFAENITKNIPPINNNQNNNQHLSIFNATEMAWVNKIINIAKKGRMIHLPDDIAKNRNIFLAVLSQDGWALQLADKSLKKDPEIVRMVVSQNGFALKYADESFKKDPEIVRMAVSQNGYALEYADESLQKDPEIVRMAVSQNGYALEYADESLQKDPEFIAYLIENVPEFALKIEKYVQKLNIPLPENWGELKIKALKTLIDARDIDKAQKNMRFFPELWGNAEHIFGAPQAAYEYLSSLMQNLKLQISTCPAAQATAERGLV